MIAGRFKSLLETFNSMREEIAFLREQSQKAYELAKRAFEDENYNWMIFLIEQALQLLLRYILALRIGYFSKTHRLSTLFEEASEISDEFRKFYEENRDKIAVVEDSYLLSNTSAGGTRRRTSRTNSFSTRS